MDYFSCNRLRLNLVFFEIHSLKSSKTNHFQKIPQASSQTICQVNPKRQKQIDNKKKKTAFTFIVARKNETNNNKKINVLILYFLSILQSCPDIDTNVRMSLLGHTQSRCYIKFSKVFMLFGHFLVSMVSRFFVFRMAENSLKIKALTVQIIS